MKNYINIVQDYLVLFHDIYDGTTGRRINPAPQNSECFFYIDSLGGNPVVYKGYYNRIPQPDREQIVSWYLVEEIESLLNKKFA
jgi:hypothetical protein